MTNVFVNIIGDLFHYGHIIFFKEALKNGDNLIVGLLNDEDSELIKRKPILTLTERYNLINSCKLVHKVIPNTKLKITEEFLNDNNIDVVCDSEDTHIGFVEEFYKIPKDKGIFVYTKKHEGISTSDIINRVKQRFHS